MRIVLETRRLVLAEMSMDDLDFYAAMMGDPAMNRFNPKTLNREESAALIRVQLDHYARSGVGAWLARDKSSGRPVGRVGLMRRPVKGVPETELAWSIHRPLQRCGYATEAAAACRDYALTRLECPRVLALIRPENLPSCGVARKIGMEPIDRTMHSGYEHVIYATGPASQAPA